MNGYLALWLLILPVAAVAETPTLCRAGETRYFDCPVGRAHKVASLCGHDTEPRWLQYRFGLVGRPPELEVPQTLADSAMRETFFFEAGRTLDRQVESISVWFRHRDSTYSLDYVQQHDDVPPESASITLWNAALDWPPRSLSCTSAAGVRSLEDASAVIWSISAPGRIWPLSPQDEASMRRAAEAAAAASAASKASVPSR